MSKVLVALAATGSGNDAGNEGVGYRRWLLWQGGHFLQNDGSKVGC